MGFSPILERGMDRERERERRKAGCVHFFGLICYRTGSVRRECRGMYGKGSMKRNIDQSFQQLEVPSLSFIDLQALIWLCMCSLPPPPTPFSFSSSLCATSKYGGIGGASHSPRHLSLLKQGPSTLRHLQIHCTSPGSVKLVDHELWQREEKGLIGIGSDSGEQSSRVQVCTSDSHNRLDGWRKSAGTYSVSYKLYKFSIGFDHLPNKPRAFFSPAKQKKIKEACNFICSPPLQISLETGKFKGHIFHFLDVQSLDSTHHWAKPFPGQDTTPIGAMSGCLGLGGDVDLWKR